MSSNTMLPAADAASDLPVWLTAAQASWMLGFADHRSIRFSLEPESWLFRNGKRTPLYSMASVEALLATRQDAGAEL